MIYKKNKTNRKIFSPLALTAVVIFSLIVSVFFSTSKIFAAPTNQNTQQKNTQQKNTQQGTQSSGASMADKLLMRTLALTLGKCINDINLVNDPSKVILNETVDYFDVFRRDSKTGAGSETDIKLLYKYGAGNSIDDGDVSCQQFLTGYGGATGGSFNSFTALGGRFAPLASGSKKLEDVNEFLEALGYTTTTGVGSDAYCVALVYGYSANGVTKTRETNKVCINVKNGKIYPSNGQMMTASDVFEQGRDQNQLVQLAVSDSHESIRLIIKVADSSCSLVDPSIVKEVSVFKSQGKNVEDFFKSFLGSISSFGNNTSKCVPKNVDAGNPHAVAPPTQTLSQALTKEEGSTVTSVNADVQKSLDTAGSNGNSSSGRINEYRRTGSVNYDKLVKYFFPNYDLDSSTVEVEKGYNWYHILKNNFDGISVDSSAGCNNVAPSSGSYLKYYREVKDDPSKKEIQYCVLDQGNLSKKDNESIMTSGDKGVVNGISSSKSSDVAPLTAKQVLDNLNSLDLPSVCSVDDSFPLCQPTPIECQQDPTKPGCQSTGTAEEDEENSEQAACMQNAGALGWMICPLLYGARDMVNGIFENAIEPLLRVHSSIIESISQDSGSSSMYAVWSFFRNIANILFVIFLLFVIFSQVTGFGIDNYGIKKIMPKLIITAIIVNFSYLICGIAIDISNLVGDAAKNSFENLARQINPSATVGASNSAGVAEIVTKVVAGIAVAAGAVSAGVTVAGAAAGIASGGALAILLPILAFVGSAALAGFFALLMLGLRQALIIVMVALSPVAFVLYAIPNTAPLFKKWAKLFQVLLTLFPVYCFMVGGGFLASNLILKTTGGPTSGSLADIFMEIVAGMISIAPYFMVPSMTKKAMSGFDGAVNAVGNLQARVNKGTSALNKKLTESEAVKSSAENAAYGRLSRFANRYRNYSDQDLQKLSPAKRRRLARSIGALNKDATQAATLGSTMSNYREATSEEGVSRLALSAQKAEDNRQVASIAEGYRSENLDPHSAIERLNGMQSYDYSAHSSLENHNHDLKLRALQSYILSTKDGQKAYNNFLKGNVASRDDTTGQFIRDAEGNVEYNTTANAGTERSRAVLARDYVENHSDLSDKYQISYNQMQSMQGSGSVENLSGSTQGSNARMATMGSQRAASRNNVAMNIDVKDFDNMGDSDIQEFSQEVIGVDGEANLRKTSEEIVRRLESDPTQFSNYSEKKRALIHQRTGNDLSDIGNRVLTVRDNKGNVRMTARFESNSNNNPTS